MKPNTTHTRDTIPTRDKTAITLSWAVAYVSRWLRDPLCWALLLLTGLVFGMTSLHGFFAALFPDLDRPVYLQDTFWSLVVAHVLLVLVSSIIAVLIGVSEGIAVKFDRIGFNDTFCKAYGWHQDLKRMYGMSSEHIYQKCKQFCIGEK